MGVCLPFVVLVNFILVSFCMFMHASSIDWWGSHVGPASARVLSPTECECASSSVCACVGAQVEPNKSESGTVLPTLVYSRIQKSRLIHRPSPRQLPFPHRKLKIQIVQRKVSVAMEVPLSALIFPQIPASKLNLWRIPLLSICCTGAQAKCFIRIKVVVA